jgi:alkylhydroperoxidase family enzyme
VSRVPAVQPELSDRYAESDDHLLRVFASSGLGIFTTLANDPDVFQGFGRLGAALTRGSVPAPVREAVILRVAATLGSDYEWGHHVALARHAGLADDDIEAVARGDVDASTPLGAAVALAAAVEGCTVDEDTWRAAAQHFDDGDLVRLVVLAGYYGLAARYASAIALTPDPGTEPLPRG